MIRIVIRDSGRGIEKASDVSNNGQGVGLANVRNRLKQLYGSEYKFELENNPGGGLVAVLELPFVSEVNESALIS